MAKTPFGFNANCAKFALEGSGEPFYRHDPMSGPTPNIQPVRWIVRIASEDRAILDQVTHRFALEFGLADSPPILDLEDTSPRMTRWIALEGDADPSRLSHWGSHVRRIAALYAARGGSSSIEITMAYIDALRVVRAVDEDAPERIYLGKGIWAEIVLERQDDGSHAPRIGVEDDWSHPRAVAFLNAATPTL